MTTETNRAGWTTAAILAGRLIFASVFIMAVSFKLMDINGTAGYIASAVFPLPDLLAWLAALLELALIACFLTGAYFSEAAVLGRSLCAVPRLRVPRAFALGRKTRTSSGSSSIISHLLRAFSSRPRTAPDAFWQ